MNRHFCLPRTSAPFLFRSLLFATLIAGGQVSHVRGADEPETKKVPPELKLTVAQDGWGEARSEDVAAVLRSAGRELLENFPGEKIDPIDVSRGKENPITLFRRTDNGAIAIRLNTSDLYWAQYSYQFAHELGHVMCRYCEGDPSNLWVEESLCELSSMFVLRRMGERWKTEPPYPNWKDFAPSLTTYAAERIKDSPLPAGNSLKQWFEKNRDDLRKSKGQDRPRNSIVAAALLPVIESEPQHWPAIRYLNAGRTADRTETIEAFIQRWHDQTPAEHQVFVRKIGAALGIDVRITSGGSSSSSSDPSARR